MKVGLAFVLGLCVFAAACSGGSKHATPAATASAQVGTATAVASAHPTGTSVGSALANFNGVPLYGLVVTAPAALPSDGVLYFSETCAVCAGGELFRAHQAADGSWVRESLLGNTPPGISEGSAFSPFVSDGVRQFAVLWCPKATGPCGKRHDGTADAAPRSLLYSNDAGVTWRDIAPMPPAAFVLGFRGQEVVVGFSDGTYALYPSGQSIPKPTLDSFSYGPPTGWQAVQSGDTEFGLRLANESSSLIGVFPLGGRPSAYFAFPGGSLQMTGWLSPTQVMGTAERREGTTLIGSSDALAGLDRLPVLIDLNVRTVAPIAGLVPSNPYAFIYPLVFRAR